MYGLALALGRLYTLSAECSCRLLVIEIFVSQGTRRLELIIKPSRLQIPSSVKAITFLTSDFLVTAIDFLTLTFPGLNIFQNMDWLNPGGGIKKI